MTPEEKKKLVVICPVYNEESVVPLFFSRIKPVLEDIRASFSLDVDLVFIDNCSGDNTLGVIAELATENDHLFYISLAKNVGYQRSLACGLRQCDGDMLAFIDVDCEDPPEMLKEFVATHLSQGYDVVYGERRDREEVAYVKTLRKLFYRLTRLVADDDIVLDMAEFCLMTAEVRDAILLEQTSFPFIRASIGRVGYRRKGIPYKRHKRIAGETHYNFVGMSKFAITGILSSSTLFLRIPAYLLVPWCLLLGMGAVFYANTASPAGLAALIFLGFSYLGVTVACIGLYVARTYRNTLRHPNALVRPALSSLQQKGRSTSVTPLVQPANLAVAYR